MTNLNKCDKPFDLLNIQFAHKRFNTKLLSYKSCLIPIPCLRGVTYSALNNSQHMNLNIYKFVVC